MPAGPAALPPFSASPSGENQFETHGRNWGASLLRVKTEMDFFRQGGDRRRA
jgi:hypothetical protein